MLYIHVAAMEYIICHIQLSCTFQKFNIKIYNLLYSFTNIHSSSAQQALLQAMSANRVNESEVASALEGVQWTQEAVEDMQRGIDGSVQFGGCGRAFSVSHYIQHCSCGDLYIVAHGLYTRTLLQ